MIATVTEYYEAVMDRGTPEAKCLLQLEAMFSATEAKTLISTIKDELTEKGCDDLPRKVQERLICLLISHRGPVLANYLMERTRGLPMSVDGPVVVPGS